MVYMEKSRLENNHGENNREKRRGENFIKCTYKKGDLALVRSSDRRRMTLSGWRR
jgi:hypothetical protein